MALKFFQNYMNTNMAQSPDEEYRELLQACVDDQWDNTTQVVQVLEQSCIGGTCWNQIDVRVDYAIEMGTGFKQDDDFKVFAFKDLNRKVPKGLMYQYDDDYWLVINAGELGSVTSEITVRRCNNVMRWVDKYTGYIYEYPCIIEYVLESPQQLKDKDVITANGHISVLCQGDELTRCLDKNLRFLFNGQPYKLLAYQNMLNEGVKDNMASNLLYLDMYLDMIEPDDCLERNVANLNSYLYTIEFVNPPTTVSVGSKGQLHSVVMLNGQVVERGIEFCCNQNITIEDNGTFTIIGNSGHKAYVEARMAGNPNIKASVSMDIVEEQEDVYSLVFSPFIDSLRVDKNIEFDVLIYKKGVKYSDFIELTSEGLDSNAYTLTRIGKSNRFNLEAKEISSTPLIIIASYHETTAKMNIVFTSMF